MSGISPISIPKPTRHVICGKFDDFAGRSEDEIQKIVAVSAVS